MHPIITIKDLDYQIRNYKTGTVQKLKMLINKIIFFPINVISSLNERHFTICLFLECLFPV